MTKSTPRKSAASNTEKAKADETKAEQPTQGDQEVPNPDGNSGPGTGVEAPAEQSARPPATMLNLESTESGPLDPPGDAREQIKPEAGYNLSSTDHVYAAVGGRTIAGEDHVRLVDDEGNELGADDLFEDAEGKTFVTAKARIYEVFRYGNTTEDSLRLMFVPGARVPLDEAARIKASINDAPEPALTDDGEFTGHATSATAGRE